MRNIQVYDDTAKALERIAEQKAMTVADLIDEVTEQVFGADYRRETMKPTKPEVFYTGGGIWLSAMYGESGKHYFVVDNEDPNCLTCYDSFGEDDDTEFPCQNMVWSCESRELSKYQRSIWRKLKSALEKEAH